jgi:hypothetical protein
MKMDILAYNYKRKKKERKNIASPRALFVSSAVEKCFCKKLNFTFLKFYFYF